MKFSLKSKDYDTKLIEIFEKINAEKRKEMYDKLSTELLRLQTVKRRMEEIMNGKL